MVEAKIHTEFEHRKEVVSSAIEGFISNPSLARILARDDFCALSTDPLVDYVNFAHAHWDARSGKERMDVDWSDNGNGELFEDAKNLGIIEASYPAQKSYDCLLILGGTTESCDKRLQYALSLGVEANAVIQLSGTRPLSEKEKSSIDSELANPTEYSYMRLAAERALADQVDRKASFEMSDAGQRQNEDPYKWQVAHLALQNGGSVITLSADFVTTANEGKHRANTGDTYAFLREVMGSDGLNPSKRVLIVTNAIYSIKQHMDALREITLETGAVVETVGFDARQNPNPPTDKFIRQELLAALDATLLVRQALAQK